MEHHARSILLATLAFLSAAVSKSGFAATSLAADVERVQKEAGKRKAFTVGFEQEFFSSLRKKTRPSSGTLSFSAPRNFRWEVEKPRKELYVNNGKAFWKYSEATRHAQRLPASSVELDFVDLVLRLDSLTQRYDVAAWEPAAKKAGEKVAATLSDEPPAAADGMLLLTLIPKQEGNQEKIHLRVDSLKAEVREMRIAYRNGNRTRLVFEALKEGEVAAARFDFVPPAGTAVDKMN